MNFVPLRQLPFMSEDSILLRVQGLSVDHDEGGVRTSLIRQVDFFVKSGDVLGVTGPSGSGKSLTALAVMGLTGFYSHLKTQGQVVFENVDILSADEKTLGDIRGKRMSLVLQQPDTALNPLMTCGDQLSEAIIVHNRRISKNDLKAACAELLSEVGLVDYHRFLNSYPHQLSGGQIQRLVLAMAFAHRPSLIICDEVTSALDPRTSESIVRLLLGLNKKYGTAIVFITHDLLLLRKISQRIIQFNDGQICEYGHNEIPGGGQHNIASGEYLFKTISPDIREPLESHSPPLIKAAQLSKTFKRGFFGLLSGRQDIEVLKDISFDLCAGEMLGVLGASGSGKTTLARILTGLTDSTGGQLLYKGCEVRPDIFRRDKVLRKEVQMVFQDALGSLNPLQKVQQQLEEVIFLSHPGISKTHVEEKVEYILDEMELQNNILHKTPHMLSGGQKQRIVLAKVLLLQPRVIVFDEALASLDRALQERTMTLLKKLQQKWGFAGVYISHDYYQIVGMSHKVMYMSQGRCDLYGEAREVLQLKKNAILPFWIDL